MKYLTSRRKALQTFTTLPLLAASGWAFRSFASAPPCSNLKLSLNAFSFNDPLLKGQMSLENMLEFCAETGFAAVDITAYYFPGYPQVPSDEFLYNIKRKAFLLGLDISGTGVRNDFTEPDPEKRKSSVALVKNWIEAAEKLGAPVIRVFAGNQNPAGFSRSQVEEWMVKDLLECIEHGKKHGVMIGLQNHNDFLQTAAQVEKIVKMVNSEWLGVILDTGSYRQGDPYAEIAATIPYTINWQVKEKVFINGKEEDTDLKKLAEIIRQGCYKGYLPIETLGAGDPKEKVKALYQKLAAAVALP
ncbi:MAG: sugar phosphate isomerase/epimerase family protein [Bacteroidia bacterium]|nr:sugar phosphate isomerase/epimerase family protein [Bacteroidia bacterium]